MLCDGARLLQPELRQQQPRPAAAAAAAQVGARRERGMEEGVWGEPPSLPALRVAAAVAGRQQLQQLGHRLARRGGAAWEGWTERL